MRQNPLMLTGTVEQHRLISRLRISLLADGEKSWKGWEIMTSVGTGVSTLILMASAIYAYLAILESQNTDRINLVSDFQKRYDNVRYEVSEKINEDYYASKNLKVNSIEADDYYRRFWDLMSEEFSAWKDGIIDNYTFSSWMQFRQHDWFCTNNPDLSVGGISYQKGWNQTSTNLLRPEFVAFMNQVFGGTNDAIFTNGPEPWKSWYATHRN